MKKFLLLLIFNSQFLIFNSFSQSPDWQWAKSMQGGTSADQGWAIAIDPTNGDIYNSGWFQATVDFDPGPGVFNLTAAGNNDVYISKFDSSGNFVWAKAIGGAGSTCFNRSIIIDTGGNRDIYITGWFEGTADFDPGAGVYNLTSSVLDDIYISKFDSSGNFVWTKQIGGVEYDSGDVIAIDPAGSEDIYISGYFGGTVDFDPGAGIFNLTANGLLDIFISKLDSSGNFVWTKHMGGIYYDEGCSIALDPVGKGDIYITGYFSDTVDFDPGPGIFNLTSINLYDIFISKLDSSGNFLWAKAMNGTGSYDWGFSIAIDPSGSGAVYTTGTFEGTTDFDPGVGVFNLTSTDVWDMFISKLDSSGKFVWATTTAGTGSAEGNSIAIDPTGSGAVYTTGHFYDTVDFDPGGSVFNLNSVGIDYDCFISKLDSSGNFVWAKSVGEANSENGYSVALDASGHVYITGSFVSPSISFGNITLMNADIAGNTADIFLAKLDTTIVTAINAFENFDNGVSIYPNPFSNSTTISFSLSQTQKVSLNIFDVSGRLVSNLAEKIFEAGNNEIVWNAHDVNAGVYFLKIQSGDFLKTSKVVVAR